MNAPEGTPFQKFCVILANLSPGNAPPWNTGLMTIYKVGLRNIPEDAYGVLTEAVVDRCTFRPTVHEIIEFWREIRAPKNLNPEEIVGELYRLQGGWPNGGKGQYVVPHRTVPGAFEAGEPIWDDPIKQKIIAAMGGWVAFCCDESPSGVTRGQLLKIAKAVVQGQDDETIQRLRLEYRQVKQLAASQPTSAPMLEAPRLALEGDGGEGIPARLGDLLTKR